MAIEVSEPERAEIHLDRDHPWPGLISFTEADHSFFFGREREVAELARMIRQETATVFFGKSGLGKSSILRAGVSPLLRDSEFVPIYIRLNHAEEAPPLEDQVEIRFEETFAEEQIEAPKPVRSETLWEYFHKKDCDWWDSNNRLVKPILIFDQFEELLTVGQSTPAGSARTASFLTELEDLIENRPPAALLKRFDADRALSRQYDLERVDYRVVLTLREDFLPDLEGLRERLRAIMFNRFRLMPLKGEQAMEVILKPGGHLVDEEVALRIIDFVSSTERSRLQTEVTRAHVAQRQIEPALLSVILQELNNRRIQAGQEKITAELVGEAQATAIFHDFYVRGLEGMAPSVREFIEDCLLTSSGARNRIAEEDTLTKPGITAEVIAKLIDRRIIQRETTGAAKWLELTHDTLADVVRADRTENQQRRQLEEAERQRAAAEEQTRQAQEREAEAMARMKQMRRERRWMVASIISFVALLGVAGILYRDRWNVGQAMQERSKSVLDKARKRLQATDNDRRDVQALRHLARSLRIDAGNREAASLLCELLIKHNWCPPLSPPLRYAGTRLLCAGFGSGGTDIVAIAEDGNLVRWNSQTFEPKSLPLLPNRSGGEARAVFSSAAMSDDGKHLVVALAPAGKENARAWTWSSEDKTYHPRDLAGDFKDPIRSATWNADGSLLCLISTRPELPARIFAFDGTRYIDKGEIDKAITAAYSPDGRLLATAAQGAVITLRDANVLPPPRDDDPSLKKLIPEDSNLGARVFMLRFSDDGGQLAATGMREPARLWDLATGKSRIVEAKSKQDQIVRLDFADDGRGGHRVAAGANGMVGMWEASNLTEMIAEPVCLDEAMVYPLFSADGTRLLTVSGPFFTALNTVRLWDTSFRKPVTDDGRSRFDGKDAPAWLSELAEAITGVRVTSDEDDLLQPPTIGDVRKKYAGTSFPPQYQIVWDRFLREPEVKSP